MLDDKVAAARDRLKVKIMKAPPSADALADRIRLLNLAFDAVEPAAMSAPRNHAGYGVVYERFDVTVAEIMCGVAAVMASTYPPLPEGVTHWDDLALLNSPFPVRGWGFGDPLCMSLYEQECIKRGAKREDEDGLRRGFKPMPALCTLTVQGLCAREGARPRAGPPACGCDTYRWRGTGNLPYESKNTVGKMRCADVATGQSLELRSASAIDPNQPNTVQATCIHAKPHSWRVQPDQDGGTSCPYTPAVSPNTVPL